MHEVKYMERKKRMRKGMAKILSEVLVCGMVVGITLTVPQVTLHAEPAVEHAHCVCGTDDLSNAAHSHVQKKWTGISALSEITSNGNYYLKQDVSINDTWTCDYNVNLCLNGKSIICSASDCNVITITGGKAFSLTDCQENAGTIKHSENITGRGIYNDKSSFYMYGGNISNNIVTGPQYSNGYERTVYKGGGVYNTGIFEMYGGNISGNVVKAAAGSDEGNNGFGYGYDRIYNFFNGAGVYNEGNIFMSGGVISNNSADEDYGGGVYNTNLLNLSGNAVISGNKARQGGGIYNVGKLIMSGGNIKENHSGGAGGGVANEERSATFTMTGGTICGNSTERSGGGVCNYVGTFIMSDQAVISDNYSTDSYGHGGGVYNFNGTFTMNGGAVINNKTRYSGGGVANYAENSYKITFTMNGGIISGNEAGSLGGGVWHHVYHINDNDDAAGLFVMNGGTVSKNTLSGSSHKGGGVYSDGDMTLSSAPVIAENTGNNLYLASGKKVSIGQLDEGVKIGVDTESVPTGTTPVIITANAVSENCFYSDNKAYETSITPEGYITMNLKDSGVIPSQPTTSQKPTIIEGANGTYKQGEGNGISFRSSDSYSNFKKVLVDGKEVDPKNYTTREGSIIVTFKQAYLDTLSGGTHSVSIVSTGGIASTNFTVQKASAATVDSTPSSTGQTTVLSTTMTSQNEQTTKSTEMTSPQTAENDSVEWGFALLALFNIVFFGYIAIRKKINKLDELE